MISFYLCHAFEWNDTTVMIFSFFFIENHFSHYRSQLWDLYLLARVNLHPPRPEMGSCEQFSWTCRSFTENFRRLKPATQTCGWTFSPLFDAISFICEDKSILRRTGSTSVDQIQSQVFLASAVELWSSKVEILSFKLLITLKHKSINHCWLDPFLRNGYRWIWSSRSKDGVFSSWKWNYWRKFGRNVILSQGERHSDRLLNKMAAKFRIDGSSLARDDFADVLINEVISNKVLSYSASDSNSKLKVTGAK